MSKFNLLEKSVLVGAMDGYLQSLRRLTSYRLDCGAILLETKLNLESAINHFLNERFEKFLIEESSQIDIQDADRIIQDSIFSRLILSDAGIVDMMKFDFLDYFNLVCLDEPENNDNPLYRNGAKYISVKTDLYVDLKLMLIKLNPECSILIFFGKSDSQCS